MVIIYVQKSICYSYVREWLAHMVVSGVLEIDDSGDRYFLPRSHVEGLTSDRAWAKTLAPVLPYVALPHEDLQRCFRNDGPSGTRMHRSFML